MEKMIPEFKFKGQPLNHNQSDGFLKMSMAAQNQPDIEVFADDDYDPEFTEIFLVKLILKRIAVFKMGFRLSNFFIMMCFLTFADRPWNAVIMMWLANTYHKRTGIKDLTISDWVKMFPFGTPTPEELQKFWLSQKREMKSSVETDNMLDLVEYWK